MISKQPTAVLAFLFSAIVMVLADTASAGAEPPLRGVFADNFIVLDAPAPAPKTELRTLADVKSGRSPGPQASILKLKGTEVQQALDTLCMEAAGYYALPWVQEQYVVDADLDTWVGDAAETQTSLQYFNNRKASIYGGSNEIQKNIISKHVLGL